MHSFDSSILSFIDIDMCLNKERSNAKYLLAENEELKHRLQQSTTKDQIVKELQAELENERQRCRDLKQALQNANHQNKVLFSSIKLLYPSCSRKKSLTPPTQLRYSLPRLFL